MENNIVNLKLRPELETSELRETVRGLDVEGRCFTLFEGRVGFLKLSKLFLLGSNLDGNGLMGGLPKTKKNCY